MQGPASRRATPYNRGSWAAVGARNRSFCSADGCVATSLHGCVAISLPGRVLTPQLTARHRVSTPVNWRQGEDVIIAGSVPDDEARQIFGAW